MTSSLTLNFVGNLGPPYFITEMNDIYVLMIPGVTQYIYKLPIVADPDND